MICGYIIVFSIEGLRDGGWNDGDGRPDGDEPLVHHRRGRHNHLPGKPLQWISLNFHFCFAQSL